MSGTCIAAEALYGRLVDRAFDKIRQAGRGMPAVMIRQLDTIAKIVEYTITDEQRRVLLRQADMIWRSACESVPEADDRDDVQRSYEAVVALSAQGTVTASAHSRSSP